jgi:hypothetical protein
LFHEHAGRGEEVGNRGGVEERHRHGYQKLEEQLDHRGDDHEFGVLDFGGQILMAVAQPMHVFSGEPQVAG